MPAIKCPRCGSVNFAQRDDEICDNCGEKLPPLQAVAEQPLSDKDPDGYDRPRLRRDEPDDDYETARPGRGSYDPDYPDVRKRGGMSEAKQKAANEVSGTLIAVAVMLLICNVIGFFALGANDKAPAEVLAIMVAMLLGLCGIFVGLGIWARWMPIPAGIIGLIIFIGYSLLILAGNLAAGSGSGMFRGMVFNVLVIIGLIRGIYRASTAE